MNNIQRAQMVYLLFKTEPHLAGVDHKKVLESVWAELNGHSFKCLEEFTRERVFWLLDGKSEIFK